MKTILRKIKFEFLCMILKMKIFLVESFLVMRRSLKSIIPFFTFCLLFAVSSNVLCAQAPQSPWLWTSMGDKFQVSLNLGDDFSPSIASNGKFYFAVWARNTGDGFDIYGVRIDRDGNKMDDTEITICKAPDDQMSPSVSWNGENFIVVWEDKRNRKRWDIFGALVSPEGRVLKEIEISIGKLTYDQAAPAIVFGKESHLVLWQGKRNSKTWNIYFTLLSKNGNVLLDAPIQLAPSSRDQAFPAAAFDGENYLLVWQDRQNGRTWNIYGARISPEGELAGEGPFQLTTGKDFDRWSPVVSWNGSHYLAVWEATQQKNTNFLGGRVSPAGDVIDFVDLTILGDGSNKVSPSILWDGSDYLLVWEENPDGASKILGASIQSDYRWVMVSESGPISAPGKTSSPSYPAAAHIEDEALVVWQEKRDSDNTWNIIGQIISKVKTPAPGGSNLTSGR